MFMLQMYIVQGASHLLTFFTFAGNKYRNLCRKGLPAKHEHSKAKWMSVYTTCQILHLPML